MEVKEIVKFANLIRTTLFVIGGARIENFNKAIITNNIRLKEIAPEKEEKDMELYNYLKNKVNWNFRELIKEISNNAKSCNNEEDVVFMKEKYYRLLPEVKELGSDKFYKFASNKIKNAIIKYLGI